LEFDVDLPDDLVIYHVDNDGEYTEIPAAGNWTQIDSRTVDITKTNGGPYDLDGDPTNGSIDDPIAVGGEASFPFFGDGDGGCTLSSNPRASVDPIWLFLLVAPGIGYLRRRISASRQGD
jgi:hypothetical protein